MKIEIDSSDPNGLRKQKQELEFNLALVNRALELIAERTAQESAASEMAADAPVAPEPASRAGNSATGVIEHDLPVEFNTIEAIGAGEEKGFSGTAIRRALEDLVATNKLELVEQGAGRRPSRWRRK